MKRTVLLLAAARAALSTPLPQFSQGGQNYSHAPDGIGTGVTIAIAPPGGVPSGCAVAWSGAPFGIAAANITTTRRADVDSEAEPSVAAPSLEAAFASAAVYSLEASFATAEPSAAVSSARATSARATSARATAARASAARGTSAAAPPEPVVAGMSMGDIATMATDMPEVTPAPGQNKMVYEIVRAGAASEPDSTITVRSTRTHTRTVTVKSSTSQAPPPSAAPTVPATAPKATELPPVDLRGKPSIKLGIIYQIDDGQIQAPEEHTPVQISVAPPAPGSAATATPPTPAIPSTAGTAPIPSGYSPSSGSDSDSKPPSGSPPSPGSGSGWKPPSGSAPTPPTGLSPPSGTTDRPRISQIPDGQVQGQITKRQLTGNEILVGCKKPDTLTLTLVGGVLKDNKGRTGYIASNRQFQFDDPPQAGALLTAGFSVCNENLALGKSTTFYQCRSGGFYNLYDQNIAPQCNPVNLKVLTLKEC